LDHGETGTKVTEAEAEAEVATVPVTSHGSTDPCGII